MAEAALAVSEAKMASVAGLLPKSDPSMLFSFETPEMYDAELVASRSTEALDLAKFALVNFRRAGESEKRLASLRVVVKAHLALDQKFEALMAASDELAMLKRAGDKTGQASVAEILAEVQTARGDLVGAMQSVTETLDILRELGDKAGEARVLQSQAQLKLNSGNYKEAVDLAQSAVELCKELQDEAGQASCTRVISRGFVEMGEVDKAPNREETLQALKALSSAVESQDQRAWYKAVANLTRLSAYCRQEVQQVLEDATEKPAASSFLQKMGVKTRGGSGVLVKEVVKEHSYMGFRVDGLGYGPRFRCMGAPNFVMSKSDHRAKHTVTCLNSCDDADDWESGLLYHPAVLASALQSHCAVTR
eukprot:TRINITY_DN63972_c0_g1_i1.p1 TRINITY_DN63972_c0_g1~~TRINITY_DN63972_c0_g1_i1.p1  ORF type:complete len:382 (+),score=86.11 TRINITY_DN63972_c0_g1_i1:56-1147(+)